MSDLRSATIRLAASFPPGDLNRRVLLAALASAPENILTPGKASESPDVQRFLQAMERAFRKHFPRGFYYARAEVKFGHPSIYIATATLPRGAQANGIIENDPSYNTFWMHDSYTDAGMNERIQIEMSQGGRLGMGPTSQKVGWRNGTGSPSAVVAKFDAYFAKLAQMVAAAG